MATWGPGNFDSDSALDKLGTWCELIVEEVKEFYKKDMLDSEFLRKADGSIIPNIDIVITLCEHYQNYYINASSKEIILWKDIYLTKHDRVFDQKLYPAETNLSEVAQRRQIVETTFNRLLKIAQTDENI